MKTFFSILAAITLVAIQAQADSYTVQKGDTLASIARKHFGEPVFGPRGTLKKLLELNPALKANNPLEPGQTVELSVHKETHAEAAPVVGHAVEHSTGHSTEHAVEHAVEHPAPVMSAAMAAAVTSIKSEESAHPAAAANESAAIHEAHAEHEASAAHQPPKALDTFDVVKKPHGTEEVFGQHQGHESAESHNYFTIIASDSMVTQKATELASGTSYTAHSRTAYGIELGWDHWWNESFSTVLTYAVNHLESKESSSATGELVFNKNSLNMVELALFNRVGHSTRLGLGAAYGDHLFLENFAAVPADPQGYIITFLNPFLAAEITLSESHKWEWMANLKVAALPAQVGFGHDVSSGTEYFAQIGCLQKFSRRAVLYALSYATEDQTRTDATETRSEVALHLGMFFE